MPPKAPHHRKVKTKRISLKSEPRGKSKPTDTEERRQYRRKSSISRRRRRNPTKSANQIPKTCVQGTQLEIVRHKLIRTRCSSIRIPLTRPPIRRRNNTRPHKLHHIRIKHIQRTHL